MEALLLFCVQENSQEFQCASSQSRQDLHCGGWRDSWCWNDSPRRRPLAKYLRTEGHQRRKIWEENWGDETNKLFRSSCCRLQALSFGIGICWARLWILYRARPLCVNCPLLPLTMWLRYMHCRGWHWQRRAVALAATAAQPSNSETRSSSVLPWSLKMACLVSLPSKKAKSRKFSPSLHKADIYMQCLTISFLSPHQQTLALVCLC